MGRQRPIKMILVAYVAAFIAMGMPNTLLAVDCSCKFDFGHCILDPACESREAESPYHTPSGGWGERSSSGWTYHPNGGSGLGPDLYGDSYGDSYGHWIPSPQMKILETGYSLLKEIGGEEPGYGLYSYALMVNYNSRSAKFLSDVFSAIPPVEDTAAQRNQTNIFYIPTRKGKVNEFPEAGNEYGNFFVSHTKDFYDYKIARTLLDHLCNSPAEEIRAVCDGDLSRGPFVFTYANPASDVTPVPAPFLYIIGKPLARSTCHETIEPI